MWFLPLRLLIVKDRQKNVRPDRQTIKVSENLTLPSDILCRPCNIKMSDRCQTDVRWIHSVNMLPIQLNQLYLIFISFHCIKYAQIVELLILQMPNSETSHFVLHWWRHSETLDRNLEVFILGIYKSLENFNFKSVLQ